MAYLIEDRKKVVNSIIVMCFSNEIEPSATGEGDEVDASFFNWRRGWH